MSVHIKIINNSNNALPEYATAHASGMDIRANLEAPVTLKPLERAMISTGLYTEMEPGYEAQIRPRSGLAAKHGITVLNTPGTIDADYRGEIKVILVNLSNEDFTITHGERIAQMVIMQVAQVQWEQVEALAESDRGAGGFGSTGRQ